MCIRDSRKAVQQNEKSPGHLWTEAGELKKEETVTDKNINVYGEEIRNREFITAVYHLELPEGQDIVKKAARLAVGQTVGTWVPIPGITEDIREKYLSLIHI